MLVLASDWLLLTPACGVVATLRRGWLPKGEEAERSSWIGDFLGRDCSGFGTPVALKDMAMVWPGKQLHCTVIAKMVMVCLPCGERNTRDHMSRRREEREVLKCGLADDRDRRSRCS